MGRRTHIQFNLARIIGPTAPYAVYVQNATEPHVIRAHGPYSLHNAQTGQYFGPVVHHPGTKPNDFMGKIVAAAQPDITELFSQALQTITAAIANS